MSRSTGTPPNQLLGLDFGPIGNFTFNEGILGPSFEEYPPQEFVSKESLERMSRKREGKTTAADRHDDAMGGQDTGGMSEYAARRKARQEGYA